MEDYDALVEKYDKIKMKLEAVAKKSHSNPANRKENEHLNNLMRGMLIDVNDYSKKHGKKYDEVDKEIKKELEKRSKERYEKEKKDMEEKEAKKKAREEKKKAKEEKQEKGEDIISLIKKTTR